MTFSSSELSNIPHTLSEPRFATYLQHCGNDKTKALELYRWNLEISAAFIVPLHLLEISIRNAIAERLEAKHTALWPWNNGLIRRLPSPQRGYNPQRNLQQVAGHRNPTTGKVVSELKFVFWQKMFTQRHIAELWSGHINDTFPNAPDISTPQLVSKVHDDMLIIRILRNRIAHHEPIFSRNAQDDYNKIHSLIAWRNTTTSDWMHSIQDVTRLIATKPI